MDRYPHNGDDCHGTRCTDCGCCMHSTACKGSKRDGERCRNGDCGCSFL